MRPTFTKSFLFSACHTLRGCTYGHNYKLRVTVSALDEESEKRFVAKVEEKLIKKIASQALDENVDFLKNLEINDVGLLNAFWKVLDAAGVPLLSLTLERDERTSTTLVPDALKP